MWTIVGVDWDGKRTVEGEWSTEAEARAVAKERDWVGEWRLTWGEDGWLLITPDGAEIEL